MIDPDEAQLSKLAKRMLAMSPKQRDDSKFGKPKLVKGTGEGGAPAKAKQSKAKSAKEGR